MADDWLDGSSIPRRDFLVRAGAGGLLLASGGILEACGGVKKSGGSSSGAIKIGFVSPETGPAASFGEPDQYVVGLVKKAVANGLDIGGKKYDVTIITKDSQSDPQHSAQQANGLINSDNVDLMLTSSTPETVNPVSDACEAAGVPCISTVVPWEAWFFGRGGKPGKTFKYTYHFSFGTEDFAKTYISMWNSLPTNKKVGAFWPNDSDGNAIRKGLGPLLKKGGYTIVDPGAFPDGTNDYSAQISKYKAAGVDIINSFALPPDFATFWKQAAQQGLKVKIAQIAKTGLFPSQVEALGSLGPNMATAAYWTPTWPYKSSSTGTTSKQLGDGYTSATGKQWNQSLGTTLAVFDVGIAALKKSGNPKDKQAVANAMKGISVDTNIGTLDWSKGPFPNVVATPILGSQWVKATGKFPLDLVIVDHAGDANVPVAAKLKPYNA